MDYAPIQSGFRLPLKPLGTSLRVAATFTVTVEECWPCGVALNEITAALLPALIEFQFLTLTKTLCSGESGEMDPCEGLSCSQDTLLVAVKVNGVGPPAPMSM